MSKTTKRPSRIFLYAPFIVAGIIVAGYYALWRTGADGMKQAVLQWAEDQQAMGYEVTHGALVAEGFPFFLRVHVERPAIVAPGLGSWRTDRLTLDALPYDFHRIIFSVRGGQDVSLAEHGAWVISADDFRISLAEDKTTVWKLSTSIAGLSASRFEDGANASAASIVFDLAPSPADQMAYVLSFDATALKASSADGGVDITRLQTVAETTYAPALPDIALWRQSGGALQITGLVAQIGEGRLACAGMLSLDENDYPKGRLNAEITRPAVFATALGDAGAITREEADAAGAALTLTSIAGGGKITAPIDLENGSAKIAGVKIADLPQIN